MAVHVTPEALDAYVAEAERGYDVDTLLARRRGRPGRAVNASKVITVRLTDAELARLDAIATSLKMNRSEAIRHAIDITTRAA